jgi:hypothetical protein
MQSAIVNAIVNRQSEIGNYVVRTTLPMFWRL